MAGHSMGAASGDGGKLLLRLTLGVLLVFHGHAGTTGNFGFVEGVVGKAGLPHFVACLVSRSPCSPVPPRERAMRARQCGWRWCRSG